MRIRHRSTRSQFPMIEGFLALFVMLPSTLVILFALARDYILPLFR